MEELYRVHALDYEELRRRQQEIMLKLGMNHTLEERILAYEAAPHAQPEDIFTGMIDEESYSRIWHDYANAPQRVEAYLRYLDALIPVAPELKARLRSALGRAGAQSGGG